MSDPMVWEENLQLISDFLISKDGIPGTMRNKNENQYVKFYMTNPDIVYADEFPLPRIAQGSFLHCLRTLYKLMYNSEFDCVQYGKPEKITFEYAGNRMTRKYDKEGSITKGHRNIKTVYDRRQSIRRYKRSKCPRMGVSISALWNI